MEECCTFCVCYHGCNSEETLIFIEDHVEFLYFNMSLGVLAWHKDLKKNLSHKDVCRQGYFCVCDSFTFSYLTEEIWISLFIMNLTFLCFQIKQNFRTQKFGLRFCYALLKKTIKIFLHSVLVIVGFWPKGTD